MDNIKNDDYYLEKILKDLEYIIEKTKSLTFEDIEKDETLYDSILFRIIQISENSTKLTEKFIKDNSFIPWNNIKVMRNIIVHKYSILDDTIFENTIFCSIPEMYNYLKEIQNSKSI